MTNEIICKPKRGRKGSDECFEQSGIGSTVRSTSCHDRGHSKCMYMTECADCGIQLDIDTHIFIMTRKYEDSSGNKGEEEKTICQYCFDDYTPENHFGWYDDEGRLKEELALK